MLPPLLLTSLAPLLALLLGDFVRNSGCHRDAVVRDLVHAVLRRQALALGAWVS